MERHNSQWFQSRENLFLMHPKSENRSLDWQCLNSATGNTGFICLIALSLSICGFCFHDCKRVAESLSVTSTLQIRSKPSPRQLYSIFSEKEAIPRDSTLYHWLELCHIATSDSKGDWGIEKF